MKIAFVTTEFVTEPSTFDGGLANYLYKISNALVQRGHSVTVLVRSHEDARFAFEGIQIERVNIDLTGRRFQWLRKMTGLSRPVNWIATGLILNRRLRKLHRQERFDVVQYSSFMATALFHPRRLPVVVRISSYHPHIREAMGLQPGSREDRVLRRLERAALGRGDGVYGPARYVAELFRAELNREIEVIETLYETPRVADKPEATPLLPDQRYLLYIGKLSKVKGAGSVTDILGPLLKHHPDLNFAFAGRDAQFQKKMRAAAGTNADRLHFLGRVARADLWPLIGSAEGVVLPSLNDNFPNTCIEAMSCRKLVVGTRGAGFEQLIDDGENGYLMERGDSSSLLAKLNVLLSLEPETKARMEERAFHTIQRLHPSLIVPQTLAFYEKTIREFRRRG